MSNSITNSIHFDSLWVAKSADPNTSGTFGMHFEKKTNGGQDGPKRPDLRALGEMMLLQKER